MCSGEPHMKANLYLGMSQWHELQEVIRHCLMCYDPSMVGKRASYDGMDIYRVDADNHLEVHLVES